MQNEKLQNWALIAEIVGGIAVLVTLIFLVIETRNNTEAIQAQTYQDLIAELNNVRIVTLNNADILVERDKILLDGPLTVERFKLMQLLSSKWGVYESAFYARERNILGDLEWSRFESLICRNLGFDTDEWDHQNNPSTIRGTLTPYFAEFVESTCD